MIFNNNSTRGHTGSLLVCVKRGGGMDQFIYINRGVGMEQFIYIKRGVGMD